MDYTKETLDECYRKICSLIGEELALSIIEVIEGIIKLKQPRQP